MHGTIPQLALLLLSRALLCAAGLLVSACYSGSSWRPEKPFAAATQEFGTADATPTHAAQTVVGIENTSATDRLLSILVRPVPVSGRVVVDRCGVTRPEAEMRNFRLGVFPPSAQCLLCIWRS